MTDSVGAADQGHQGWVGVGSAKPVFLVACASKKREGCHPAKDLYVSPLFRKSRAVAERFGRSWFILSAKYGLVNPAEKLSTYDLSLQQLAKPERNEWALAIVRDLKLRVDPAEVIVVLAGRLYRDRVVPMLRQADFVVYEPTARLGIGKQLRWLTDLMGRQLPIPWKDDF